MWQKFLEVPHLSEYIGLIGLLLTVFGFLVTIWTSFKAKSAADSARVAAEQARSVVKALDVVSEVATVIQLFEDLKRLHRGGLLDGIQEKYSSLKIKVISIRESGFSFEESHMKLFQDVVARLNALENSVDRNLEGINNGPGLARANRSLSSCLESMVTLDQQVKSKVAVVS